MATSPPALPAFMCVCVHLSVGKGVSVLVRENAGVAASECVYIYVCMSVLCVELHTCE